MLAPLSWLALIIGACLPLLDISKSTEFAMLALLSWSALIIWACLSLRSISKSSEFAGVGSAVVVGFDHRGVPCSNGYL